MRQTVSHDLTSLNPSLPVVPPFLNDARRSQGQRLVFSLTPRTGLKRVGVACLLNGKRNTYHQLPRMLFRPQIQVPPKPAKPFS